MHSLSFFCEPVHCLLTTSYLAGSASFRTSTDLSGADGEPDQDVCGVPASGSKRLRQVTMMEGFGRAKKEEIDRAVADFFYANGIAFNVARSPYWSRMIDAISKAGIHYKAPSSEALRTSLLVDASRRVVSHVLLLHTCTCIHVVLLPLYTNTPAPAYL